jgi:hypothetical protein
MRHDSRFENADSDGICKTRRPLCSERVKVGEVSRHPFAETPLALPARLAATAQGRFRRYG